jgi:7-cyano-7-deazaguanine tRNA-ribosyltransferase
MPSFELVDRDGLARLGRLETPHGVIETPALLPVVHPAASRQPIAPEEMRRNYGIQAVITSAYITWRDPVLRQRAESLGIHGLLGFDGAVMTDSGAFQQHAYGQVEIGPLETLEFQERIGADIATVLDRFVEPDVPRASAEAEVLETLERAKDARSRRRGLLAVPVQGALDAELRRRSSEGASQLADVVAVGGVVPLMERYRFGDLVRVLHAVRAGLLPGRPVHLFGTGHPMLFALATLFGVDLFDSSAYHKFARRGDLLFPEGTVPLARVSERICACRLCDRRPLASLRDVSEAEREQAVAEHNLLVSLEEVGRVRQAIREGSLWELVEQRMHGHPALLAASDALLTRPETFLPTEPTSRRSFRILGPESLRRPAVVAFRNRLERIIREPLHSRTRARIPLVPSFLSPLPESSPNGDPIPWTCPTPFGSIPVELSEVYPVGPAVGPEDFENPSPAAAVPENTKEFEPQTDRVRDWTDAWTKRHAQAVLRWAYGREAGVLVEQGLVGQRSRRTGRLRSLWWSGAPAFAIGNDGIPRPGWLGGQLLHQRVPPPRNRVTVIDDAKEFVANGRSLFARFARSADASLQPGSSVLLVDEQDQLLAVGRLVLAPHEFASFGRGVAARVTAHAREAGVVMSDEPDSTDIEPR